MKRYLWIIPALSMCSLAFGQRVIRHADGSYYKQCIHFEVTKPLRELAKEHPTKQVAPGLHQQTADAARKRPHINEVYNPNALPQGEDPVRQSTQGTVTSAGPIVNYDGLQSTQGYDPLDPNGMVGTNDYVETVNTDYRVYDKNGNPKTSAIDFQSLFPNSTDDGDPVVMYDKFADRWVITEFQSAPGTWNENELLFAVSKTSDPTGSYYLYTFEPDPADFADYPKYSVWSDGYYETCNCDNQKVTVYERAKMLAGDSTAGFIVIPTLADPSGNGFFCPQTLDADGQLPPYGSPQYYFYYTDDNWGNGLQDQIHIYKITTDWTNKTGTFTSADTLATQPFNSYFTGGSMNDISQPGTSQKLDALDGFFSYRISYTRWPGYNDAVMCYPVNVGSGSIVAGIRWYELRQDTTTMKWSIYQQGTYAPSDGVSRWNPSIAMNADGSIGLAYSVCSSSGNVYPGIRYTGRNKCDSLGVMTLAETSAVAGSSSWTSDNRWGDYSLTSVDPSDGITFWHCNQYVGNGGALKTRVFSFQVPPCTATGIANHHDEPVLKAFQSGNAVKVQADHIPVSGNVTVDLFNIAGKYLSGKILLPNSEKFQTSINTFGLAKGIYLVRIGNNDFQRVVKVLVQ